MAFANSSITDIIATTIQNRSGTLADNVTNNNAILRRLRAKGNVKTAAGGNVILQEIMYVDATMINVNSYSGYEVINIAPNSPISAASFNWTQYAGAVTMSGLEMLQNSSKEQIIDLMEGRISVAEAEIQNRIDYDIYQDGTGNGGKNITGLALAVPDDPTTGTYGGISRGSYTFWRSQYYRGVTDGGSAVSAANIQAYMSTLALRCVRGNNKPDLWVADNTYFALKKSIEDGIDSRLSAGDTVLGSTLQIVLDRQVSNLDGVNDNLALTANQRPIPGTISAVDP